MKKIAYSLIAMTMTAAAACSSPAADNTAKAGCDTSAAVDSVIMSRRSIRKYTGRTISRDTLEQILKCGINAPNGQNRQAYEIRVIDNPALLKEISDAVLKDNPETKMKNGANTIFAGAPCVVFIACDTSYDVSQVDCGLLGENIILSAWAKGIGSCCMAYPVRLMSGSKSCAPYIERLGFSQGYSLLYSIVMGYPDESPEAKPRVAEKVRFVE